MAWQLTDEQRSYFGLGWEYKRRKKKKRDCPFKKYSYAWDQFMEGFEGFRKPKMEVFYEEKEVKNELG